MSAAKLTIVQQRDVFAGHALEGILASASDLLGGEKDPAHYNRVAQEAFRYANAMIAVKRAVVEKNELKEF